MNCIIAIEALESQYVVLIVKLLLVNSSILLFISTLTIEKCSKTFKKYLS